MQQKRRDSHRSDSTRPPDPPVARSPFTQATWDRVVWSYLVLAGTVGLLIVASSPFLAVAAAGGLAVTVVALQRARSEIRSVVRCLRTCPTIQVPLGDRILVTITRPHLEEDCCDSPVG